MKTILITLIVLLLNVSVSFSQDSDIYKLRTTDLSLRVTDGNGDWGDWADWIETDVLIIFNFDSQRIKIFSKETQIFDIANYEGKKENDSGDEILTYFCVDDDGIECFLELWNRPNKDGTIYRQLYVRYSNIKYVYNYYIVN